MDLQYRRGELSMTRQNIHSDIDKEKAKQHLPNRSAQYGTNAAAISDESERTLLTANGEQTIYEAVSRCNRCNICSQNCPSYDINKKEQLSPRGRSQLFRLIKEEKLKRPTASLKETLATCYLCGACEDICKSSIPIPEIVLELRKRYLPSAIGFGRAFALYLKLNYPKIYDFWTRTGLILFKLKLGTLSRLMCTAGMLGRGNREFEKLKIVPPFHCALSKLNKNRAAAQEQNVKWAYFSSCDTNYIMPEIALSTVELLQRHMGYGILFNNTSSGLASWRFGREKEAELFVKKNIEIFERLRREHGKFIVVTDFSAVAAFLKNLPTNFYKRTKKSLCRRRRLRNCTYT